MSIDKICSKIAASIRGGYFNAGEYSGFSARGEYNVKSALMELVEQIKKEVRDELKAEFGIQEPEKPKEGGVLFRQHRGSLHESMKTVVRVHSRQEILDQFEPWLIGVPAGEKPDVSKLSIAQCSYDERIDWNTHLVVYAGAGVLGQTNGPLPEDAGTRGEDGE